MKQANKNKSFVNSKCFIICSILSCLFLIIFLYSVINLGIRFNYFSTTISQITSTTLNQVNGQIVPENIVNQIKNQLNQPETIFSLLVLSKKQLLEGYQYNNQSNLIFVDISKIVKNFPFDAFNMNLGFLIMTVIFLFAFIIPTFPLIAFTSKTLCILKTNKMELKKQKKLALNLQSKEN